MGEAHGEAQGSFVVNSEADMDDDEGEELEEFAFYCQEEIEKCVAQIDELMLL